MEAASFSPCSHLEIDVDDCQDVAAECEVKCMSTFQFHKKGQKVGFDEFYAKWAAHCSKWP